VAGSDTGITRNGCGRSRSGEHPGVVKRHCAGGDAVQPVRTLVVGSAFRRDQAQLMVLGRQLPLEGPDGRGNAVDPGKINIGNHEDARRNLPMTGGTAY
jgi:hypothetical protein